MNKDQLKQAEQIKIGTEIKPYGKIGMIGYIGERYYWFVDKKGCISMLPASFVENS